MHNIVIASDTLLRVAGPWLNVKLQQCVKSELCDKSEQCDTLCGAHRVSGLRDADGNERQTISGAINTSETTREIGTI